jgi:hypothetical protein
MGDNRSENCYKKSKQAVMKKILVALTTLAVATGCSKDNSIPSDAISAKATVDYMGDPAVDGLGWVLRIDRSYEVPTNLPEEYKQDELDVNVVYTKSDQFAPCHCLNRKQMVNIITISRR